jgi:hypothetical protein
MPKRQRAGASKLLEIPADHPSIEMITDNWEMYASLAYESYLSCGRGAVRMRPVESPLCYDILEITSDYITARDPEIIKSGGWPGDGLPEAVVQYDPRNELILLVYTLRGLLGCSRISAPIGGATPRVAAYHKATVATPSESEDPQLGTGEFSGGLGLAIHEMLRACKDNLELFHSGGLERHQIIPSGKVPGDFDPQRVLSISIGQGVLKECKSGRKKLLKPGPKWGQLEQLMLSDDKTDSVPS